MIYFVIFVFTGLLAFASGRARGLLRGMLLLSVACTYAVVAALRDVTVGTDVMAYAFWECQYAAGSDFLDYFSRAFDIHGPAFAFLTWMICGATGLGLSSLLFVLQLLVILPILLVMIRVSPRDAWVGVVMYGCIIFPFALNGMKQAVAVALVGAAVVQLVERRPLRFLIVVLLAATFHQTALISLTFYPVVVQLGRVGTGREFFGRLQIPALWTLIFGSLVFVIFRGSELVVLFSRFKDSYSYQLERLGQGDLNLSMLGLGIAVLLLIPRLRACKGISTGRDSGTFEEEKKGFTAPWAPSAVAAITLIGVLFAQFDLLSESLGRFGWYGVVYVLFLPLVVRVKDERAGIPLYFVGLAIIFFLMRTVLLGLDEVYPYTFAIVY